MSIHAVRWFVGGLLGVALLVGGASFSAEDPEKVKAEEAAVAAVRDFAAGKGDAKGIAQKHELENVMVALKLRSKRGIGVGGKPGAITPDGIESKIQSLTKVTSEDLPKLQAQLKTEGADLIKMLEVTRAIAEINAYYPDPAKKNPKLWKQFNEDMIKASKTMQDMIKTGDAAKVKTAVNKLSASCNDCHKEFRDN